MASQIKSQRYIQELKSLGYEFRMNETTDRVEVTENGKWVPLTDPLATQIRVQMRDRNFRNVNEMQDAYIAEARKNSYHPVKEYLEGLEWSGQPAIEKLASYFKDKHGVFCPFLRRWLINAISKALYQTQGFMLVLAGPQDAGKSTFVRFLCPKPLKPLFMEGGIKTDDKDTWLRLCDRWIWEVAELGATTRKTDREALKDFVTRKEVTIRQPYGRYETTRPALASLIGTINAGGGGFLNDPTGNRRFAVVELLTIDFAYAKEVDINEVWAEAYHLLKAGESPYLTKEEKDMQRDINADYEVTSAVEELFWTYYDLDPDSNEWTPIMDIVTQLEIGGAKTNNQHHTLMKIADILKAEDVEKRRVGKKRVTCYRGIVKKPITKIGP